MSNAIQNILIILGLLIVALLGGYLYLDQTNQSLSLSAFRAEPTVVDVESQEFLARLELMQTINFNEQQVFADNHFRSLRDYGRPIVSVPVGRDNPFSLINQAAAVSNSSN